MIVWRFYTKDGHFYIDLFPFDTTIHKDVSERLKTENPALYMQVKDILEINKQERHIRGGLATKRKYEEYNRKMHKHSDKE